jgi:hypothetical protein
VLNKTTAADYDAAWVDSGRVGRNRIINGDFSVNQRGFASGSAAGVNLFGFDRWLATGSGGTATYSAQAATLGDLPESAKNHARLVTSGQAAAGDFVQLLQRIESVRTLSGKTATISFWAKAAAGTPKVAVELVQSFGAGGSAITFTYAGQAVLSTSWARVSVTVAVPSIAGKTVGTGGDDFLAVNLWTSGGSTYNARTGSLGVQNGTFDFWGVQVEEGLVATTFEQKPLADELRACMRYYTVVGGEGSNVAVGGTGLVGAANTVYILMAYPVRMRAVPALTWTGNVVLYDGTNAPAVTGIAASGANGAGTKTTIFTMTTSGSPALAVGRAVIAQESPSAAVYLNAEL